MSGPPYHGRTHRLGGTDPLPMGMPHVNLRGNQNGYTFNNGATTRISFDTALLVPINNGGVIDPDVFSLSGGGPWDTITALQPGVYWGDARIGWWRDWGACSINLRFSHASAEVFPVSDSYGLTASVPSEPGVTFDPIGTESHVQTAVSRRGFIIVDELAGDVDVWAELTNSGGSNRTFNNTTNSGTAQLFLMQMSQGSRSRPNP